MGIARPDFDIEKITLICPKCGAKLKTNVCECCGQVIDISSFIATIDINPEEIF